MKRYIYTLLLMAVAMSCGSCSHKERKEAQEVPEIDVAEAVTDSIVLYKTYPGYLSSKNSAEVVARVDGQLMTQTYKGGQYVSKGQVLFTIDPTLYRDIVSRARAALASAESNRDYAKSHYEAVMKAFQADAVSKMETLNAESALEQAEANIKDCKAALNTAEVNLGYCTVRAPLSGYITDSYINTGNYVSGSGQPQKLAKIYDNSSFDAVFEIEDNQYESMIGREGKIADKLLRSIPLSFREQLPHSYVADLTYESPTVAQTTGTIQLKGTVKNQDGELKDGMYVTVSLPYGANPSAVLVKDASIGTDQRGKYLYVVNDSGKVEYAPIEIGALYEDSLRVVTKGIGPGARYVTKALLTVRPGETIKPVMRK